jgi:hypothetical protein
MGYLTDLCDFYYLPNFCFFSPSGGFLGIFYCFTFFAFFYFTSQLLSNLNFNLYSNLTHAGFPSICYFGWPQVGCGGQTVYGAFICGLCPPSGRGIAAPGWGPGDGQCPGDEIPGSPEFFNARKLIPKISVNFGDSPEANGPNWAESATAICPYLQTTSVGQVKEKNGHELAMEFFCEKYLICQWIEQKITYKSHISLLE